MKRTAGRHASRHGGAVIVADLAVRGRDGIAWRGMVPAEVADSTDWTLRRRFHKHVHSACLVGQTNPEVHSRRFLTASVRAE
jgi:hypothetical protein